MAPESILDLLRVKFAEDVLELHAAGAHPHAVVTADRWRAIARFLRDDERLGFDWLRCITGVDHIEDGRITVIYDLHATRPPERESGTWQVWNEIAIKIHVDRTDPHVPSVADIWSAANWHERETYDLLGVIFDGHPDPRRILCCDDWVGHPLRRDYEFPLEYNGIPAVTEYDQTRPRH